VLAGNTVGVQVPLSAPQTLKKLNSDSRWLFSGYFTLGPSCRWVNAPWHAEAYVSTRASSSSRSKNGSGANVQMAQVAL